MKRTLLHQNNSWLRPQWIPYKAPDGPRPLDQTVWR